MKTLTPLCCVLSLILSQASVHAEGLYKWKDSRGNTQYGDRPPANVNAQPMELPKITIIDNYAEQWKPMTFDESQSSPDPVKKKPQTAKSTYTKLAFLAPKQNQAIRANDGDVSAMISIKPPLKKGHQIVFSIDGKSMGEGKTRTKNFSNLNRGSHTIGVKVVNRSGKTLKSSSVEFNVLRASSLNKSQSNQATKLTQAKTLKSIQQQQTQVSR
ncbi:MAG: hypothetical protein ACI88H_002356 [Cocleimonas sp.]|jgi:hypothetical protein